MEFKDFLCLLVRIILSEKIGHRGLRSKNRLSGSFWFRFSMVGFYNGLMTMVWIHYNLLWGFVAIFYILATWFGNMESHNAQKDFFNYISTHFSNLPIWKFHKKMKLKTFLVNELFFPTKLTLQRKILTSCVNEKYSQNDNQYKKMWKRAISTESVGICDYTHQNFLLKKSINIIYSAEYEELSSFVIFIAFVWETGF